MSGFLEEECSVAGCGSRENSNGPKLAHVPFLFRSLVVVGVFWVFFVCLFYLHFWVLNDIKLAPSEFILKIALRA